MSYLLNQEELDQQMADAVPLTSVEATYLRNCIGTLQQLHRQGLDTPAEEEISDELENAGLIVSVIDPYDANIDLLCATTLGLISLAAYDAVPSRP